ncbi:MAG: hypothetical protein BWX80_04073 [Candidatus Hydrogenedentes bacterium ADurb.Bin101]|nr:MAG: hypothetical protein BWX80_04073 [Candidatus Hydrogenedentes bacterium ADurb.Bin101]
MRSWGVKEPKSSSKGSISSFCTHFKSTGGTSVSRVRALFQLGTRRKDSWSAICWAMEASKSPSLRASVSEKSRSYPCSKVSTTTLSAR